MNTLTLLCYKIKVFDMQSTDELSSRFDNVALQTSIKHLKIILLSACLICKSDVITEVFPLYISGLPYPLSEKYFQYLAQFQ